MHAWTGWTVAAEIAVKTAPSWDEWCAWQLRRLGIEQRQQARQQARELESLSFSDRELARLSFVRWLYQTGRLDQHSATTTESTAV